jgi:hypothetical protein
MSTLKSLLLANYSRQNLKFKYSWKDGHVEQLLSDGWTVDVMTKIGHLSDNTEVTIETMFGNQPITDRFTYARTGEPGKFSVNADGSWNWG